MMRKRIMLTMISMLSVFFLSFIAYADDNKPQSINEVLSEIRQEQGLKSDGNINPDLVSKSKLEALGDSVMEAMIGNSEIHDQMDKRMGGDGSASLSAMHQRIGYNYLSGYPNGMMNIMSGGMMGNYSAGMMSNYGAGMIGNFDTGMMGNYGNPMMGYFGWPEPIMVLLFIIFILVIAFFVIKTVRMKGSTETPVDILKRRYAEGEISHDEFEQMKQNLEK